MSELTLAHTERRIQTFLLKPLSFFLIVAIAVSLYHEVWWAAVAFGLLWMYVGHIGSQLMIHRGKSFEELSQGITPELPANSENVLSDDEMFHVVHTMLRLPLLVACIAVIFSIMLGMGYWAALIGLGVWLLARLLLVVLVPLMASQKMFLHRSQDK